MARIPYFDMTQASASFQELLKVRHPLNLFRMLPHAGPAAEGFLALGGALLREGALDPRLREIAILRVGLLSGAGYEEHQHRRLARRVGLADDKVAALDPGADTAALADVAAPIAWAGSTAWCSTSASRAACRWTS